MYLTSCQPNCGRVRPCSVDSLDGRATAVPNLWPMKIKNNIIASSYFFLSSGSFHYFFFLLSSDNGEKHPVGARHASSVEHNFCGLSESPISWLTSLQNVIRWTMPSCTYFICKETSTSILKIPDPSVWQLGLFSIVKFWSHTLGLGKALTCHF